MFLCRHSTNAIPILVAAAVLDTGVKRTKEVNDQKCFKGEEYDCKGRIKASYHIGYCS